MAVWTVVSRLLAVLAAAAAFSGAAQAEPVEANHLEAELVAQGQAVPGGETYVALIQRLEPGWHSYWRNPGSAGEATELSWTLPDGWSAGPFVWATPERIPVGPLVSFAYEGEVVLPVAIRVPADARPGSRVTLKAEALFLVCKEICVPAQASLSVDLEVAETPTPDAKWAPVIAAALAAAPKPSGLEAALIRDGGSVRLAIAGDALNGEAISEALFFPYEGDKLDAAAPQPGEKGRKGVTLSLTPLAGASFARIAGVLSIDGQGYEIEAVEGPAPAGASGLGALKSGEADGGDMNLPLAALFALLGGLILNLMPCVFPVLSMKGAQLASHAHDPRAARMQGLAFLGGVLVTFLALAGVLLAARAAGSAAGWGFQLQSPAVTAGLTLLMLLIALNLFGVFEIGASAQGVGEGLTRQQGLWGAGFTGALAVVVAAPCTAPFMAAALGYAVSRPPVEALTVFAALGLGFAAPFTALCFAPALLRRLPRPGPWMSTFRTVLAFPMLAASAWLAWVFSAQASVAGLGALFASAILVAFAAWLFGRGQRAFAQAARVGLQLCLPLALIVAALLLAAVVRDGGPPAQTPSVGALKAAVWSPQAVAEARAQGRPVFVDFTAAWCVTCQVNEQVALSGSDLAETIERTNAVYMKADWTNRNAQIAGALAEHGRAGVPLYLVYPANGAAPKVLPQLLTEGMVRKALEEAAGPGGG